MKHSPHDITYQGLLKRILTDGNFRMDRTGTGAYSLFGEQLKFDMSDCSFPLLTTKKMFLKGIIHELLWFLKGDTNIKYLKDHGVNIWDEWADSNGDLGPVYGAMWRKWPDHHNPRVEEIDGQQIVTYDSIDQIAVLIDGIKANPFGRRHIVSAWSVADLPLMKLPPCHCLFQFFVSSDSQLSLQLYQRSADVFLGVPFNIASYALLLQMVAQECGLKVGTFTHTFGDVHIYANHVEQVKEQLNRAPLEAPHMHIEHRSSIFDHQYEDFKLLGYESHPAIKAPIAV